MNITEVMAFCYVEREKRTNPNDQNPAHAGF